MSVRVNVRTSKIMRTPIKVAVRTYATYANCRTLYWNLLSMKTPNVCHLHYFNVFCNKFKQYLSVVFNANFEEVIIGTHVSNTDSIKREHTQPEFTCSKLTMETPQQC